MKLKSKMIKTYGSKVYLVEDITDCPGRIYAVFAHQEDAQDFLDRYHKLNGQITIRTLLHGQHTANSNGTII